MDGEVGSGAILPRRSLGVRQFTAGDELVLVCDARHVRSDGPAGARAALTLNASGRAIWELCDGEHRFDQIVGTLGRRFSVGEDVLGPQVRHVLAQMERQGFLRGVETPAASGPDTTFVIGIEDKPYFWWQAAIFLESLEGKLPAGWRPFVVICNNGRPVSPELRKILECYGTEFCTGTNHAETNRIDVGLNGGECHAALNRVEALAAAGRTVGSGELVSVLDSDIFLYGDLNLQVMPTKCALSRNWHIAAPKFFSTVDKNNGKGIDLGKLLDAMGCEQPFRPGGVNVFVTGAVAQNPKFIADCFRFAHALFLLGRAAGAESAWIAEMPCFALALTTNGIEYELIEAKELLVSDCDEAEIPNGAFYHYYSDPRDFGRSAFRGSKWHKQAYRNNFLDTDFEHFAREATTDHERYFFELARRCRQRLDV
ncbi:PqqD family peptide modification chaperone [Devosia sp.]|uniref:PqqD family peptide modification chaperone n=1 Tax=Devosia sp. TaxID=1871048 RepID=UPI0035B09F8F